MSVGAFTDRKQRPTEDAIREAIGARLPVWQELIHFLRAAYQTSEDLVFLYGKNYGWALRFRVRGKLLTSLYPARGGFTVQINLSRVAVERVQSMKLGERAREAFARAKLYPEGKWLFLPVESAEDVRDIRQLLVLKLEPGDVRYRRYIPNRESS